MFRLCVRSTIVYLSSAIIPLATAGTIHWRSGAETLPTADSITVAGQLAHLAQSRDMRDAERVVVQFARPVSAAERNALRGAGLELLSYVGDNAYFAKVNRATYDAGAAGQVAALQAAAPIEIHWKLHPTLDAGAIMPWAIAPEGETPPQHEYAAAAQPVSDDPTVAFCVLFHADVDLMTLGAQTTLLHGAQIRSVVKSVNGLVIELPWSAWPALAAEPIVQYIEPPLPLFSPLNNSNRERTGAAIAQQPPYDLDGSGVSVMVYDGGTVSTTHPDLAGRVNVRDSDGLGDHPTHVAGTIGGDGTLSGGYYAGMAPAVTIESYGFEQEGGLSEGFLYSDPGDLEADYTDAINNWGADLANNSIGTNTAPNGFPCDWTGDYGVTSALIDAIARGSLGQPFRIVWANGNERSTDRCGSTYATTAPPAGAKNHIAVGALNSNDDSVTSFTSWGPVDDGRLKPDIAAPGCQSDDDQGVTSTSSYGDYNTKCGTSMACPTVTGLASLLLQDYRAQFPNRPDFRNSTLKALLAHTAADIEGPGPDFKTGYGSVRIVRAIDQMRAEAFYESEIEQSRVHRSVIFVNPGDDELRVTLAWDDFAGTPNVVFALVNDLDLRVIDPAGGVHYPWTLSIVNPEAPAVQTLPNHVDNLEQVVIAAPLPGKYIVEIDGFAVPEGPQPFSLVASPTLIDCSPAAILTYDQQAYACESTLELTLIDCDLNTDDGVIEQITLTTTSSSEPGGESVTLVESGPETARFVGTLPLSTTDATGVLQVAQGDSLTTTYVDADDGQGGVNILVEATAPVDCATPLISNIQAIDLTPRSARVVFDTDEPAQVRLRYGLTCGVWIDTITAAGFNTSHSISIGELVDETTYYFEIEAVDYAGNTTISDAGGVCHQFTTPDVPDYFTEQFFGNFDLGYSALEFKPNESVDYYAACRYDTLILPSDPAGGTPLAMSDNGSATVPLTGGATVELYGVAYSVLYVNANGNITFDQTDGDSSESYDDHFDNARIAAFFDDLNPAAAGEVRFEQLADRAVVTWLDVTEDSPFNHNTFQIEMWFDGKIVLTWLNMDAGDAIVGLSQGLGTPIDFLASSLSNLESCGPRPPSAASEIVVVGQGRNATLTLNAIDDGDPAPPVLTFWITSLPTLGSLIDAGNDYTITPGDLPYLLSGGGRAAIYAAPPSSGQDSFTFVARDGGAPPTGGDSNTATIDIRINPVLKIPVFDDFPETSFSPDVWAEVFNATISTAGLAIPSPPYAARFNGQPVGFDSLTSHLIDLSGENAVRLSYRWQRTGGGESPDSGDNLLVQYIDDTGSWVTLREYAGDGDDMSYFESESVVLPLDAMHQSFQLRFQASGSANDSNPYDDWFIDNVNLSLADAPFAESFAITVERDVTSAIMLLAEDPDLDPLSFIITALPTHGTLSDPAGGVIDPNDLPYVLLSQGDTVQYTPDAGYQGGDAAEFLAFDGLLESNLATVTIAVEPILTLPLVEMFPSLTLDPERWAIVDGATADNTPAGLPSPPLALRLNKTPTGGDLVQTFAFNLSEISPVQLQYYWERTGPGDSPETGDDLLVEFLDERGVWTVLNRHEGAGDDMVAFDFADIALPPSSLHAEFRLRFRAVGSGTTGDDWFVDDILLFIPQAPMAFDQNIALAKYQFRRVYLEAIDPNGDQLEYVITSVPATGELLDSADGHVILPEELPYSLLTSDAVDYFPPLGSLGTAEFSFMVSDGVNPSNEATIAFEITAPEFSYFFPLNVDPQWDTEGLWEYGEPLGRYDDPIAGYTGPQVYGYNLNGRYENNLFTPRYLTTGAIDCSSLTGVQLEFYRWLGVEGSMLDYASIDASADGQTWESIWLHTSASINEQAWSLQTYDLSAIADEQATLFVRWGMGPSDATVELQGWNLDDITFRGNLQPSGGDLDGDGEIDAVDERGFDACFGDGGVLPDPPDPMRAEDCLDAFDFDDDGDVDCRDWDAFIDLWTGAPTEPGPRPECGSANDMNCDGHVDFGDIDPFVLAITNRPAYEIAYNYCDYYNADCNGDGHVDFGDIDCFVAAITQ